MENNSAITITFGNGFNPDTCTVNVETLKGSIAYSGAFVDTYFEPSTNQTMNLTDSLVKINELSADHKINQSNISNTYIELGREGDGDLENTCIVYKFTITN